MSLSRTRRNAPAANEEWPDLLPVKIGEVRRIKMESRAPAPKHLGLSSVSAVDLRKIKQKDAFMYYSIPGVLSSKLLGVDVDPSDLGTNRIRSCPSRLLHAPQRSQPSAAVTATRSRRITFECHSELLFDDLSVCAVNEEDEEEDEDDPLDLILERASKRQED